MRVRLDLLEQQNHSLMMNQLANQSMAAAAAAAGQMGGRQQLGGLAGSVASFLGQDGTATGSWSLLDRLTIERAAAQNRIQALLQQQQQSLAASNSSSMGNIKSSSDVSDSARAYPG